MDKKTIGRYAVIAISIMVAVSASAEDDIEGLKSSYPEGMYVTGRNLWNIDHKINSAVGEALRQRAGNESIPLIEAVIAKGDSSDVMNEIAFIHLNLETLKAFEMRQDGSGTPTPLSWNPHEVTAAAIWCDEFLKTGGRIRKTQLRVSSNEISVENAMARLDEFLDNMFVSEAQLTDYRREVRSLVARSSDEIAALEGQKPELYAKIDGFRKAFDHERLITKVAALDRLEQKYKLTSALTAISVPDYAPDHLKVAYFALNSMSQDVELLKTWYE